VNASSVDVPVALLGYGTVGSAVERLLDASADEIERATGHRLRVVRALVRDPAKERPTPARDGVLADVATRLAAQEVSVARLLQEQGEGEATLHVVTHTARLGAIRAALAEIAEVPGTRRPPYVLLVVSDSGRAP